MTCHDGSGQVHVHSVGNQLTCGVNNQESAIEVSLEVASWHW